MKKVRLLFILPIFLSPNVSAFFNTAYFSPFENGKNYNNIALWDGRYNWNPLFTDSQYSPENDARNRRRYGAQTQSLKGYRQNSTARTHAKTPPNRARPSNWLIETDFSKTLENIKNSNSKTFFVYEMPTNFNQTSQAQIKPYTEQAYGLSPAADSTSRVNY